MNRYRAHPPSRHNDNIPWGSSHGNRSERDPQNPRTAHRRTETTDGIGTSKQVSPRRQREQQMVEVRTKQQRRRPVSLPAIRVARRGDRRTGSRANRGTRSHTTSAWHPNDHCNRKQPTPIAKPSRPTNREAEREARGHEASKQATRQSTRGQRHGGTPHRVGGRDRLSKTRTCGNGHDMNELLAPHHPVSNTR